MSRTVEIQQQRRALHSVQLAFVLLPVGALLLGVAIGSMIIVGVAANSFSAAILGGCVAGLLAAICYYQKRLKSLLGAR